MSIYKYILHVRQLICRHYYSKILILLQEKLTHIIILKVIVILLCHIL